MLKQGPAVWHPRPWLHARRSGAEPGRGALVAGGAPAYHLTPFRLKDWYFRDFLAPRLAARGLHCARLRDRNWSSADGEPANALCG